MQAAVYMPPPKRPKSDVQWTAFCSDTESERDCCSIDDNLYVASVNAQQVDDTVATWSNASPTPCSEIIPAISTELPLDLRRTDVVLVGYQYESGGSRQQTTTTSLRRLLLEPLAPAPALHRPPPTISSPDSAAAAAAAVAETPSQCRSQAARVVEKPPWCPTNPYDARNPYDVANSYDVCVGTSPVAVPSADARQAGIASCGNQPSAALRRILLDDDVDDGRKHAESSVASRYQSSDCLLLRLASGGSCSALSPGSTGSSVDGSLSQQAVTSGSFGNVSQTAPSLFPEYTQLTGRLKSRTDSSKDTKYSKQRRPTSNGLK